MQATSGTSHKCQRHLWTAKSSYEAYCWRASHPFNTEIEKQNERWIHSPTSPSPEHAGSSNCGEKRLRNKNEKTKKRRQDKTISILIIAATMVFKQKNIQETYITHIQNSISRIHLLPKLPKVLLTISERPRSSGHLCAKPSHVTSGHLQANLHYARI